MFSSPLCSYRGREGEREGGREGERREGGEGGKGEREREEREGGKGESIFDLKPHPPIIKTTPIKRPSTLLASINRKS